MIKITSFRPSVWTSEPGLFVLVLQSSCDVTKHAHREVLCEAEVVSRTEPVPDPDPECYLAGEGQRGGHLLHGQVPDAGAERAAAGRAAAQLLAARVADQVTRLALQDGRQHVVEAHRTLEQGRQLGGLPGQAGGGQAGGGGHGPGDGADTGGRCRCHSCGRGGSSRSAVLSSARFAAPESSTSGSGRGRTAHGSQLRSGSCERLRGRYRHLLFTTGRPSGAAGTTWRLLVCISLFL